jgi:hypothetical protein
MSATYNMRGKLSKPQFTTLTSTYQTVFTAPKNGSIFAGFVAVNTSGGNINVDVVINDGATSHLAWFGRVDANGSLKVDGFADMLLDGYTIQARGNTLVFRPIIFSQSPNDRDADLSR